jgi:SH2 domain-containing adapter protein B/D/E/F
MKIVSTNSGGDSDVDRHYILGQFSQPFDSIPQMIHHYTINKLPIKGAEHMSLLHPVNNELL